MNSQSLGPKPILPPHLSNGDNHAAHRSSPLRKTSINGKEREALTASIKFSQNRRQPINLDYPVGPQVNGHATYPPNKTYAASGTDEEDESGTKIDVPPRDPRNQAPEAPLPNSTRPASPYTLNPPIDFDGLSWPSEWHIVRRKDYS